MGFRSNLSSGLKSIGNNPHVLGKAVYNMFADGPDQPGMEGTGYQKLQIQNYTPEQMQLHGQRTSQLNDQNSYLSRLSRGDESLFRDMEAPAEQDFSARMGNMASRFSGRGMGGRRSSGFQNATSSANRDFAMQLRSNRMQLQQQASHDLWNMGNQLLSEHPYENKLLPKKRPFGQELLLGFSEGAGKYVGSKLP